ncbi:MAG: TlpA disulfide reductase family protein [Candidatus Aminicenantes bacterium]|jgi:peroxiredoxin
MKKLIVLSVIVSFLLIQLGTAGADTGNKEWLKRIYRLYGDKQYLEALYAVEQALKAMGSSNQLLQLKYNILVELKRYDEALAFINSEIKKSGETGELLAAKYSLLFMQGNLVEALKVAKKKDKIAKSKSPWDSMNIMHVYLRMGSKNEALDWLQEAVRRGFISYRLLEDKKYAMLHQEKRFYQIIETIKVSIGLGYPAKNFTVKLLNGDDFTLEKQRGKVVLIYFWAYWCQPCKQEMPYLDKIYREFKDKGLEMVGISLDSSIKKTEEFIRQHKLQWKHSCSGKVWKDKTVTRYGVNTLPSLWVVDKNGILRSFDIKGEELRKVIAVLLSGQ